jgi:DNA-binding transcriptional LysR family regulator
MVFMYIRYLEYLRRVVEHGSFAAAAQAVGVSQPAISHGIRQLQRHFASPLLVRSGRRSMPTELALRVASDGMALTERMDALVAATPHRSAASVLRVGLTPSAALVCGPALYSAWCQGRARRRLELSTADEGHLLAGLKRHGYDMVVSPRPRGFNPRGLTCQALYQLQPVVYARKAHPLSKARTLADLQGAAWVSVGPSVRGPVDVLTEAVSCPDYASMLNLMSHSDLLGVVPHPVLLTGDARQLLVPLRLREALPLYEMWVFQVAGSRQPVRQVVQQLSQALAVLAPGS